MLAKIYRAACFSKLMPSASIAAALLLGYVGVTLIGCGGGGDPTPAPATVVTTTTTTLNPDILNFVSQTFRAVEIPVMTPVVGSPSLKQPANVSYTMLFDMEAVKWRFDFRFVVRTESPLLTSIFDVRHSHVFDLPKQRHTHTQYSMAQISHGSVIGSPKVEKKCVHAPIPHAKETGYEGVKACLKAEGAQRKALSLPDGLREFEVQPDPTQARYFLDDDFLIKKAIVTFPLMDEKTVEELSFPASISTIGPPEADAWFIEGDNSPGGWCTQGTLQEVSKLAGAEPLMFKKCSGLPNATEAAMSSFKAQFLETATAKLAAVMSEHRARLSVV